MKDSKLVKIEVSKGFKRRLDRLKISSKENYSSIILRLLIDSKKISKERYDKLKNEVQYV